MKISVVIVSWNVKDLLRECLQSIFSSQYDGQLEVIVVDNGSHDGSGAMVRAEFPSVRLIATPKNLGYAGGNNIGVVKATGDFIFLLNPDTVLAEDALAQLSTYLLVQPEVGVVGPQLRWPDGSTQSSRRRFPTIASMFWESTLLEQWFPNNRAARQYKFADQPDTPDAESMAVDWVVGAALFIRRAAWQTTGPLDEDLFMYFEETDWCRRCVEAGWLVHYVPQAVITHYEGQSSQQVMAARTIRFQRSKVRYTKKWFGRRWALAVQFFLLATFAFQWLEEAAKWAIGHKRPLRRERIVAYWQVLKSGLG